MTAKLPVWQNGENNSPRENLMVDLARVSHTHERIMDWMIENPEKSLRECADNFGYTQPWLSSLIHSDAFQAMFQKLSTDVHVRVANGIPARMAIVANIALDKLADAVAKSEDKDFLLESSDKILHRMGYAPKASATALAPALIQNNTFVISADDLRAAREEIGKPQEITVIDAE